jgi:hypothetical protein
MLQCKLGAKCVQGRTVPMKDACMLGCMLEGKIENMRCSHRKARAGQRVESIEAMHGLQKCRQPSAGAYTKRVALCMGAGGMLAEAGSGVANAGGGQQPRRVFAGRAGWVQCSGREMRCRVGYLAGLCCGGGGFSCDWCACPLCTRSREKVPKS